MLGVSALSGGYDVLELIQVGADRVYRQPSDSLRRIAEIGLLSLCENCRIETSADKQAAEKPAVLSF